MSEEKKDDVLVLYENTRLIEREGLKVSEGMKISLDREKLALEREKMALEREKIALEYKKLAKEDSKLAVTLYVEDFKARWQELLNFENENNRWVTLYVTALLLVISWMLSNGRKYNGLAGLYGENDNAYFIMSIAIINALYTFSMAIKGYQIQQIALYQFDFIAGGLWEEVKVRFNDWERYRRDEFAEKRGPEPIRRTYYILISLLPTLVSYAILFLYLYYEWSVQASRNGLRSFRNWFCIAAFGLVTLSLVFAGRTTKLNKKWDKILERAEKRTNELNPAPEEDKHE
jgi:hypothetical protein